MPDAIFFIGYKKRLIHRRGQTETPRVDDFVSSFHHPIHDDCRIMTMPLLLNGEVFIVVSPNI